MLKSVLDVTDAGVVTKGGESLHHLEPRQDAQIPISAIGMADPGGDGTATFDIYARSDGTLAVLAMSATWTAVNGSARTPVRMTLDYTFSNVGDPVVIERPAQIWTTFASKRFKYSIALPSDWEAEQSKGRTKPDILLGADVAGVYVYRFPTYGASLNSGTSAYVDDLKRSKTKAKVTEQGRHRRWITRPTPRMDERIQGDALMDYRCRGGPRHIRLPLRVQQPREDDEGGS